MFSPCWKPQTMNMFITVSFFFFFLDIVNTVELILFEYVSQESAFLVFLSKCLI